MTEELRQRLYTLEPQYRERVWGGQRLKPHDPPYGEAWVAFEESRVREGERAGRTVQELAEAEGAAFLGAGVEARYGRRFPLLVKLLDCADWLSVQVHPNDSQARRLVGPREFGKTEAWHFLEAEPGATIYAGVKTGTSPEALEEAIRAGRVLEVAERIEVEAGETVYIPAGTLHALGPGLLLYEVQQSSDTTYRVYDWDRPATAGRKLHVEESIAVADPERGAVVKPTTTIEGTTAVEALSCPHFNLEVLGLEGARLEGDTGGRTFHLITVTGGAVEVSCGDERLRLGAYETALVAGGAGRYEVRAEGEAARALRASVPVKEEARGL
ncbi:MAG TPA: type I phosphomannose isomerase catalytic subunit [Pyrinomonadaceae bacterium]|nr:type I phosphomannose isomerase catalytic subunit [Pyrinomonadaceae bacterium]